MGTENENDAKKRAGPRFNQRSGARIPLRILTNNNMRKGRRVLVFPRKKSTDTEESKSSLDGDFKIDEEEYLVVFYMLAMSGIPCEEIQEKVQDRVEIWKDDDKDQRIKQFDGQGLTMTSLPPSIERLEYLQVLCRWPVMVKINPHQIW